MGTVTRRAFQSALVVLLVVSLAIPPVARGAAASLGTARGLRAAEMSLDGGQSWLPLGGRALPVLDGSRLRTSVGGALVDLTDGSRLNVLPFSALEFRETGRATEVTLVQGRLLFRLAARARVEIRTAAARVEAAGREPAAGEVFAGPDGTTGLRASRGSLQVQELAGGRRTLAASLQPVFLPKPPAGPGPHFALEQAAATPPADARGVFSPRGESVGYLRGDRQLVVHPGYTEDLTRPFPPKLVQLALARVPEAHRADALPLFDVNGGYVGYLAGPVFYAQAQLAPTTPPPAGAPLGGGGGGVQLAQAIEGGPDRTLLFGLGGLALLGAFFGANCLAGTFICEEEEAPVPVATPLRPRR